MKMIFTIAQMTKIQNILISLDERRNVKEFDVMYNPLMPKEPIVRYKSIYTGEDGGVGIDIYYICVDEKGNEKDCVTSFGDSFYLMLKDYTPISLSNPNIQLI